jgi:hypothetical protein
MMYVPSIPSLVPVKTTRPPFSDRLRMLRRSCVGYSMSLREYRNSRVGLVLVERERHGVESPRNVASADWGGG